jgi:hypothetical protein
MDSKEKKACNLYLNYVIIFDSIMFKYGTKNGRNNELIAKLSQLLRPNLQENRYIAKYLI